MSTYWSLECASHDPKIGADGSLNHGNIALLELVEAFKEKRVPTERSIGDFIEVDVQIWCESWPWIFLMQHKNCEIKVVSEYGDICWRNPGSGNAEVLKLERKST